MHIRMYWTWLQEIVNFTPQKEEDTWNKRRYMNKEAHPHKYIGIGSFWFNTDSKRHAQEHV